jgi:outer membrane receptor protein involved in Fe transport
VLDRLEILVGARFFHDEREEVTRVTNFGLPSLDGGSANFHAFNPRLNVSYHLDGDGLLYFNAAKGFRSGGFNAQSAGLGIIAVPPSYAPEKVWSYEAGTKHVFFDHRLIVEAAVYYNDWTDIQTIVLAPGSTLGITANGGKASGWGADFLLTYKPLAAVTLGATLGWNDMHYNSTTQDHFAGDPMDFVPQVTASLFGEYRFQFQTGLAGMARADFQHTDGYQFTSRNSTPPLARSDAINTINLRVGVEAESWQAYLFANNVTDVSRRALPTTGLLSTTLLNTPRVVGANLRLQF